MITRTILKYFKEILPSRVFTTQKTLKTLLPILIAFLVLIATESAHPWSTDDSLPSHAMIHASVDFLLMAWLLFEWIQNEIADFSTVIAQKDRDHIFVLRTICHDLATPLFVISSVCEKAESLSQGAIPPGDVTRISRSTDSMAEIIAKVRLFQAIASKSIDLDIQATNLGYLLDKVVAQAAIKIKEENLRIALDTPRCKNTWIYAEPTALANHVFAYLIEHIIKFCQDGDSIKFS